MGADKSALIGNKLRKAQKKVVEGGGGGGGGEDMGGGGKGEPGMVGKFGLVRGNLGEVLGPQGLRLLRACPERSEWGDSGGADFIIRLIF